MNPDADQLKELSREWMQAWVDLDRKKLEALVGPGFTLTSTTTDDLVSRETWMEAAFGKVRGTDFSFNDFHVSVYGDAGVVKSRFSQSATIDGQPWTGDFNITDVWVRRDGRWQVVARHSSRPVGVSSGGAMGASDR